MNIDCGSACPTLLYYLWKSPLTINAWPIPLVSICSRGLKEYGLEIACRRAWYIDVDEQRPRMLYNGIKYDGQRHVDEMCKYTLRTFLQNTWMFYTTCVQFIATSVAQNTVHKVPSHYVFVFFTE